MADNFFEKYKNKIEKSLCCWEWKGGCTGNGYGAVKIDKKQIGTHVAAFLSAGGQLNPGDCVMHSCDNPKCVRPEHLSAGTVAQNMRDKRQKLRSAGGEKNGRSKLTEPQVREIKELLKAGIAKKAIARKFEVSDTLIRYIAEGKNWTESGKRSTLEISFAAQLEANGMTGWIEEHRFHPTRLWRLDFAFPDRMIAVECEGGTWINGRHNRGAGSIADMEKYNEAQRLGWSVFRFHGGAVMNGDAIRFVMRVLNPEDKE